MAIEIRQLPPPADVRGLIEGNKERESEPATWLGFCMLEGGLNDRDSQCRHDRGCTATALLRQAIQRIG